MDSLIALLQDTPIPTILVVSGIVFLFLALAGQIAGKLEVPPARQKWAAAIGAIFLGVGLLLYLAPSPAFGGASPADGGASLPRAAETEISSNPIQPAAAPQGAEPASSDVQPAASSSSDTEDTSGCLEGFFAGIAPDRIVLVESGAADKDLLTAQQSRSTDPAGIVLLELGQPVVALSYYFFEDDALFKIGSLVDGACQPVDYANGSRGGDKNVLQNWDTLEVTSGTDVYALRFSYYVGVVALGTSKFQK